MLTRHAIFLRRWVGTTVLPRLYAMAPVVRGFNPLRFTCRIPWEIMTSVCFVFSVAMMSLPFRHACTLSLASCNCALISLMLLLSSSFCCCKALIKQGFTASNDSHLTSYCRIHTSHHILQDSHLTASKDSDLTSYCSMLDRQAYP